MTCIIQPIIGKIDNREEKIPTMFPDNFVFVVIATTSETVCKNNIVKNGNPVRNVNSQPKMGIAINASRRPMIDLIM